MDASQDGLGAVLLQEGLPVAYASKAMSDIEKDQYSQIGKETLAIVFGCERFHQYVFAKKIHVESDHQPLESIFAKPLDKCPARLKRMRLRLQAYDIKVVYKPGKELFLADALSRSFLKDDVSTLVETESQICMLIENLPMTETKKDLFKTEIEKDDDLQTIIRYVKNGWPADKKKIPDVIRVYATFKDDLSIANGLLFKNDRIVVPKSLRKDMLDRIHYSHMGIEKCKNKARELLYWPNMSKEIEDKILNCSTCLSMQRKNPKEPLMPKEIPDGPWQTVGVDFYFLNGKDYMLVVDYFSKFIETVQLKAITSELVITQLKSMFARFGIPKLMYSDGGTQFTSKKFKRFTQMWKFEHKTSSPIFAQSNGMVERHVGIFKLMLDKCVLDSKDPYLAVLEYRNTPISNTIPSPAEIMLGRKVRGLLPIKVTLEQLIQNNRVKEQLLERQIKQKLNFDKTAKELKPLDVEDNVFIARKGKHLIPAKVTKVGIRPRSYEIKTENGSVLERNRKHLLRGSPSVQFEPKRSIDLQVENTITECETSTLNQSDVSTTNQSFEANPVNPIVAANPTVNVRTSTRAKRAPLHLKDYVT